MYKRQDLKELNYLFSTIPSVRIVLIAGNHDRIRPNSAVLSFSWCPNVTYLTGEDLESVYFKELNTEVYGFSYHTAEIKEDRLTSIQIPETDHIRILLAHGGDALHLPFNRVSLAALPFDYIALGQMCIRDRSMNAW